MRYTRGSLDCGYNGGVGNFVFPSWHCPIIKPRTFELSPQPGNVAPDFLAAKLIYRIMGYVAESRGWM